MKKSTLITIAAVAVGVVVVSLGTKKPKPTADSAHRLSGQF